jgi:hypothetical protein
MSFLLNQIAQHKVDAPTKILYISFLIISVSHPGNICAMFTGGIKRNFVHHLHNSSHLTIKEKVLVGLFQITETTL